MPNEPDARLIAEYVWRYAGRDRESKVSPESVAAMRTAHPTMRGIVAGFAGTEAPPSRATWSRATHLFAERVAAERWRPAA